MHPGTSHQFGASLQGCDNPPNLWRAPLGLHTLGATRDAKLANPPATSPVPRPPVALAGPLTSDSRKSTEPICQLVIVMIGWLGSGCEDTLSVSTAAVEICRLGVRTADQHKFRLLIGQCALSSVLTIFSQPLLFCSSKFVGHRDWTIRDQPSRSYASREDPAKTTKWRPFCWKTDSLLRRTRSTPVRSQTETPQRNFQC